MPNNNRFPNCPLCNEPVELETSKTDNEGKAVHEECYVLSLAAEQRRPAAAQQMSK